MVANNLEVYKRNLLQSIIGYIRPIIGYMRSTLCIVSSTVACKIDLF